MTGLSPGPSQGPLGDPGAWLAVFWDFFIDLQGTAFSNFRSPRSVAVASLHGAGEH